MKAKTFDLAYAQSQLGNSNPSNRVQQAIIPMTGRTAGNPHDLDKHWQGGEMYWDDNNEIEKMRSVCEKHVISGKTILNYGRVNQNGIIKLGVSGSPGTGPKGDRPWILFIIYFY